MAENQPQHNTDCCDDEHAHHLCYLMYDGFHYACPAEYKVMVQDAQYRCQNCGRTAHQRDQLCKPVAL